MIKTCKQEIYDSVVLHAPQSCGGPHQRTQFGNPPHTPKPRPTDETETTTQPTHPPPAQHSTHQLT